MTAAQDTAHGERTGLPGNRPARAAGIPPNCLHDAFRQAEQITRETGRRVIGLHVGEPAYPPPDAAVAALVDTVRSGRTAYTSCEGGYGLRAALAERLAVRRGVDTTPDRVFVCPGSCEGLAAIMLSAANPGDEVLMPALHWPIHLQQVLLAGLRPVFYPLAGDFGCDPEAVAGVATARTRLLLVNSPANPTGAVLDRDRLARLLDLAHRNDWHVISDEAYEDFVYDGEHVALASLERDRPPARRRVYSTYTFSKTFAMTGYRLGYVVAPHDAAAASLRTVQEACIVAPSAPVEAAGLAALGAEPDITRNRAMLARSRAEHLTALVTHGLLRRLPAGGWYAILDVGRHGWSGAEFADALLRRHGVGVAAGRGFALRPTVDADGRIRAVTADPAADGYVRIAFCGDPHDLGVGVQRILACLRERP